MLLHTRLNQALVTSALRDAKRKGRITGDVRFMTLIEHKSKTHAGAFEIQLGTWERTSLPAGYRDQNGRAMTVRRHSGTRGAASEYATGDLNVYSTTWHEWGWFMAEIFQADPDARFGWYGGRDDFNVKTRNQFNEDRITTLAEKRAADL